MIGKNTLKRNLNLIFGLAILTAFGAGSGSQTIGNFLEPVATSLSDAETAYVPAIGDATATTVVAAVPDPVAPVVPAAAPVVRTVQQIKESADCTAGSSLTDACCAVASGSMTREAFEAEVDKDPSQKAAVTVGRTP